MLATNQHSLSDAEGFSGEPTAGWIIDTWNVPLADGTVLRLPRQKLTDAKGQNMELRPRPVDVEVVPPVGEWYTGKDAPLDAAIAALAKRMQ